MKSLFTIICNLIFIGLILSQNSNIYPLDNFICGTCYNTKNQLSKLSDTNSLRDFLNYARVHPLVIRKDIDTFTLELGIKDTAITSIKLKGWYIGRSGNFDEWFNLVDDGSNGDNISGDYIYTANDLSISNWYKIWPVYIRSFSGMNWELGYNDGSIVSGTDSNNELPISIRAIDTNLNFTPNIVQVSDDCQKSDYVVNLVSEKIFETFPLQHHGFDTTSSFPYDINMKYYELFADDRDFLIVMKLIGLSVGNPLYAASFSSSKNEIQGIGRNLNNANSWIYENVSRLRGTARFYGHYFLSGGLLNHELLHHWAAWLDPSLGFNYGAHWINPIVGMQSSGFGAASQWDYIETIADSIYNVWYNNKSAQERSIYSPLEQYLMGLIPPEDVPEEYQVLVNPSAIGNTVEYRQYQADSIRVIKFSDILTFHGNRIPDNQNSQKEFQIALIVPYERFLTPVEMSYFESIMREYEKESSSFGGTALSFFEATEGRASLSALLSSPLNTKGHDKSLIAGYQLNNNYPNPFNPKTTFGFNIPTESHVKIMIYDLKGSYIATLINNYFNKGTYSITWDGRNEKNQLISSGIYFYQIQAGEFTQTKKMILLR